MPTSYSLGKTSKCSPDNTHKTRMSTFTSLTQHGTGLLTTASREEGEMKGIHIRKEEVKLSLFADDMIFYIENPEDSRKKLLEQINTLSKIAAYKLNIQKSCISVCQ